MTADVPPYLVCEIDGHVWRVAGTEDGLYLLCIRCALTGPKEPPEVDDDEDGK